MGLGILGIYGYTPGWQSGSLKRAVYQQPWQSGRYYFVPPLTGSGTSATLGNGNLNAIPFWVPNGITLARLGAEITAAGDAGCKLRLGIYADDGTGRPGALLLDAGTIAGDSVATQEIPSLSLVLSPGVYWAAAAVQLVTVTQPTVRTVGGGLLPNVDLGSAMPAGSSVFVGVKATGVTGALPGTFTFSAASGATPRMFIKVA